MFEFVVFILSLVAALCLGYVGYAWSRLWYAQYRVNRRRQQRHRTIDRCRVLVWRGTVTVGRERLT